MSATKNGLQARVLVAGLAGMLLAACGDDADGSNGAGAGGGAGSAGSTAGTGAGASGTGASGDGAGDGASGVMANEGGAGATGGTAGTGATGDALELTHVTAGSRDSCGVQADGTLWCWGNNTQGDLVGEPKAGVVAPTQVGTDTDWKSVVASGDSQASPVHHCGIKTNGDLLCWGDSGFDSLGIGFARGFVFPPMLVKVAGPWSDVSTIAHQVCGVNQGKVYCWGSTEGVTDVRDVPEPFGTDTDWKSIAVGGGHVCGLKTDHTIHCWGAGKLGQLGQGGAAPTTNDHLFDALQVGTDMDYEAVASGMAHSCGLKSGGTIHCWGRNREGTLGDGTSTTQTAPVQAGNENDWTKLYAGGDSTCAINASKELWCWGHIASFLRTQAPPTAGVEPPVQVGAEHAWVSAAVSLEHACAITDGGEAHCWGKNAWGQLGDGTSEERAALVQVRAAN